VSHTRRDRPTPISLFNPLQIREPAKARRQLLLKKSILLFHSKFHSFVPLQFHSVFPFLVHSVFPFQFHSFPFLKPPFPFSVICRRPDEFSPVHSYQSIWSVRCEHGSQVDTRTHTHVRASRTTRYFLEYLDLVFRLQWALLQDLFVNHHTTGLAVAWQD